LRETGTLNFIEYPGISSIRSIARTSNFVLISDCWKCIYQEPVYRKNKAKFRKRDLSSVWYIYEVRIHSCYKSLVLLHTRDTQKKCLYISPYFVWNNFIRQRKILLRVFSALEYVIFICIIEIKWIRVPIYFLFVQNYSEANGVQTFLLSIIRFHSHFHKFVTCCSSADLWTAHRFIIIDKDLLQNLFIYQ